MKSDYNDVDKLLSHMHLNDFAYRSFKHGEPGPPLRVVRSTEKAPESVKAETAPRDEAAPPQTASVRASVVQPITAKPVSAISTPAAVAPASAEAMPASSRISDALERLNRGFISESAPKLNLHLALPPRPGPQEVSLPSMVADQPVGDVFQRLRALAVLPPKAAGRGER